MTVRVDRDTCIGCGLCPTIAPDIFAMDDENIAIVGAQPGPAQEGEATQAADSCPVNAIEVAQ